MREQEYSVLVKKGAGWKRYNGVRLLISVGQPYHNGNKFSAVVDWVNKNSNIQSVQVVVGDILQGWNDLANDVGGGKAFKDAEQRGTAWLAAHDDLLCSFNTAAVSVTRWGQWLDHPEYPQTCKKLAALIDQRDNGLGTTIVEASEGILARRQRHGIIVPDTDKFLDCSRRYIKEEIVVLALMHKDSAQEMADVYPGSALPCMRWFQNPQQELPAELEPLRRRYFCRIDFKKTDIASGNTNHTGDRSTFIGGKTMSYG